MPDKKLPISEFAAKLKVKYPEYKDFNDTDLVIRVTTKYPQYKDVVDLSGLSKKKEVSEPALPTGGKVGISEAPSEEGGAISKAIGKGLKTALDESKKQRQVAPKSVFGPYGLTRPSEPTAPKISQKIDAGIKVPRSKIQLESSSEVDEIEGFFNAYERGVRQGELADMMALGQTPNRENLKEIARLNKEISSIPSSAAYERFNATDNIGDAISEFIDNPFEITTQLVAESLSALVRHGYSRALAGAAVGAAAGSVVPGIGTVAGINSGYIAGIGVASYNLEMASSIMDSFREAGVDVTDEKSLTEAFDNPETLSRAKSFAQKRAVPIAIFDMFSAGMGGKLLGKPTKTMLAKLGRGVAEVGIQSGLAGAGEATAQVVSGQKINPTAIFSEMIGEVGGGAPDIAIGTMIEKTKQGKKVGEEAVKLDVKPEVLQDMLDISEGAGEITSEQSEQIKKQYEDIQKIKQSVPEEFKKNAEVIESLQQKRALEEAKKGLDPIFAKKIDEQIKALDTKIDNVISKVPAAEELTYRVDYFDPETNKMASKMFATEKEGSAFQRGLTSEQNKYGSKGYYTSAKGVGEVAPEAAPELPATQLAENFKKDFNEGALKKGEYGGARNLGVYDYQGGIVKVVKEKRKLGENQLTLMKERLGDMDNVYIPKAEVDLGEGKSAVVMDKATGIDASKLTKEDIDAIPQEHWDKFEADIRELSKRGVAVDLTKRDNFFYDKDKGFSFIDISGISIEGEPTTKFFVKDGVEMYYPLEQYPFSKKFEGGKKMFENIAEIKKKETAPEVAAPVTELPATPETQKKSIENIIKQEELDISPDQLDRLYDEAVKGGGKIEESQVRKILNVGYLRASRIAEEINDLGVREVKPEVPSAKQKPIVEVKSSKEVKQGDTVVWRGEDFIVDEVNPKGGFNLRNVSEPTNTVKDARITDVEFEGKRGEVAAKVAPKFFSEPIESLKNVESTAKALGGVDIKDLSKQIGIELAEKISESEDFETATKAILTEPNKGMANLMLGKEKEIFSKQDVHSHTYPKTGKTLSWDLSIYENSKGQKRYVLYERKYPEQIDAAALVDKDGKILQITTSKDFRKIGLAQTLLSEIKLDIGKIIPSEPISKAGKKALDNFTKQAISEAYHKAKADGSNPELVKAVEDLLVGEVTPKAAPEVPAAPKIEAADKRAEARKKLKDALDDFLNAGIVYDPRSQAEKQVRLTKAIINAIREEAIGAIKDLKKYLKENIGIDISDNDAKYLLIESKKPEYAIQEPAAGEVPVQPEARVSGKVEAGVPPTEPPKVTPEGESPREEKRLSGIKKALVSKEVLDKVDFERTGDKQLLAAGRQIIESGEVKPKPLVNKIVEEGKGVLTPAEVVALITYKADLDTQVENLTAEIEKMEAAGQDIGTKGVELKELELDQQNFDIAAVITAQQQSLSFRLRMWMLDSGYNLQKEISQYKKINNGTIPEDVKKRFEEYDAEIQRLKKRIKDVNAEKVDQEGEQAAANIVEDVQREGAILTEEEIEAKVQEGVQKELNKIYEQLPAKKKSRADQAIAALEKIQKRLRNRTYDAALGIPVALIDAGITTIKNAIKAGVAIEKAINLGINKIKDGLKGKPFTNEDKFRKDLLDGFEAEGIKKEKEEIDSPSINEDGTLNVPERFLRQLVRDGVTTIEGMTDAVFQELQSQLPELTKRQVRDAITQYGKTVNPTKDDIRRQIGQAKRIGRLISELEDLQKMNSVEFALKYGKKKPQGVKITEGEKNLKKEIKALAKSLKTNEQNLAEAKSAAKRRIEELQRRIKEKDFSSKEKPVIKADAELEMLYSEKRDLENKFVEEKEKARLKNRPFTEKMRDVFQEITTGIPRILVAGFDLSATLVQGVRTLFTKPKIAAGGFIEGLRQFGSIERNENFLKRYRSSYNGVVAKNSGLAISDVDGKISAKDQIFVIKWANALYDAIATVVTLGHKPSAQFIKNINPLKASQRAYDGAVNYIRTRSFDEMMKSLQNDGYTPESNPEQFKAAADFINTTTGRASLGKLEGSAQWLSTVFFSPRKLASEFKLYSPLAILYYGKMPSAVRKRALANFAKFTGSVLITHLLLRTALQSLGEEQDDDFWDPDSSNFLSFKINGKTVSVLGGVKSMIVFMSRFLLGNRYVDQYGVESELGKRPAKKINTKLDLVTQFGYGKFAPTIGALADYYDQNPDYEDDDEILRSLVVPLWLQDANEIYKDDPLSMTLMFNFLSVIGANIRKVDVVEVRDKIIFKEKVNGKEVKRIVELTDDQKEEFQDIANSKFQLRLKKLSQEINSAKTSSERAEYTKMAADKAKKDAQEIMERRYKAQFRQFPIEDAGEQDKIMERVKKKLQ